ncbi:hypothetical protein QNH98_08525 [Myroides sp. mNGS23_01]|nr:hypothetical protein [Myroides sp. mNGS23_01]WHT40579.1 hypothetical protein QNH98_08525 [Myroides sp. mNGS23_01]
MVKSLANYQVHLNYEVIETNNVEEEEVIDAAIKLLKKVEGVAFVVDMNEASKSSVPQLLRERIINGYNYKRSGAIQLILNRNGLVEQKMEKGLHMVVGIHMMHIFQQYS